MRLIKQLALVQPLQTEILLIYSFLLDSFAFQQPSIPQYLSLCSFLNIDELYLRQCTPKGYLNIKSSDRYNISTSPSGKQNTQLDRR